MVTSDIAVIGYALQGVSFSIATAVLLLRWKHGLDYRYLGIAAIAVAFYGYLHLVQTQEFLNCAIICVLSEFVKYALWIAAVVVILRSMQATSPFDNRVTRIGFLVLIVATPVLVAYSTTKLGDLSLALLTGSGIVMALVLISGVEQIFRNLPMDSRSGLKLVGSALLVIAAYDIVYFTRVVTAGSIVGELWAARGFVYALTAVPLTIAALRLPGERHMNPQPRFAYYATLFVIVGSCVVIWLIGDFYVHILDGSWAKVATIVFVAATFLATLVLLTSRTIRGRARVYLTKVFFRYKYDYRKEWLRFIGILSESGLEHVPRTAVRAVAPIVNSPGGIVWIQQNEGDDYLPVGSWQCELPVGQSVSADSYLIRFLRERQWVIDLNELQERPKLYDYLQLDTWMANRRDFWLIVPLLIGKQLLGMIVLLKPRMVPSLNFEDHDLLRTVGRHVGTHIKQAESDKRLAETSQFGTYHRLTAFLMHDMNNLIAQQSLVVKNAERFRHDPKFVDDTIETIAHSVDRMRRLMKQLSRNSTAPKNVLVSIVDVLNDAVKRSDSRKPAPILSVDHGDISLLADAERLTMVIEHLIRNAQDATEADGKIEVDSSRDNGLIIVAIRDTGCGMSAEFVSERLFKPFDSTKGSESMGIGVYQAREYVRMLGGQLEVNSQPRKGTTFTLRLPVADV
jgi:putative PEP-CTERM system histidine kinase